MHVPTLGRVELVPSLAYDAMKHEVETRSEEAVSRVLESFAATEEGNAIYHEQNKSKFQPETMVAESNISSFQETFQQDWVPGSQPMERPVPDGTRGRGRIETPPIGPAAKGGGLPYQNVGTYLIEVEDPATGRSKMERKRFWPFHLLFTRFYCPEAPHDVLHDHRDRRQQPTGKHLTAATQVGFECMYPSVMETLRGKMRNVNRKNGHALMRTNLGRLVLQPKARPRPLPWEQSDQLKAVAGKRMEGGRAHGDTPPPARHKGTVAVTEIPPSSPLTAVTVPEIPPSTTPTAVAGAALPPSSLPLPVDDRPGVRASSRRRNQDYDRHVFS